jgi:hypothetical protein
MIDPKRENISGNKVETHNHEFKHIFNWGYVSIGIGILALALVLWVLVDTDSDDEAEDSGFME